VRPRPRPLLHLVAGLALPGLALGGCLPPLPGDGAGGGEALFSVSDGKGDELGGGWDVVDHEGGVTVVDRATGEAVLDVASVGADVVRIALPDGTWAEVDEAHTLLATTIAPDGVEAARYRAIADAFAVGAEADDKADDLACIEERRRMAKWCVAAVGGAVVTIALIFSGVGTLGALGSGAGTVVNFGLCDHHSTLYQRCRERHGGG
jgi:hypothetical protein